MKSFLLLAGLCAARASLIVDLDPAWVAKLGANPTHYGDPKTGCEAGEQAVQVQGVAGDFCSPSCAASPCPSDVPSGVTAKPQCALQSPTGAKYCALICTPSALRRNGANGQCGTGACQSVQGIGLCTYAASDESDSHVTHLHKALITSEYHGIVHAVNADAESTWTAEVPTRFALLEDAKQMCGTWLPGHPNYVDPELPLFEAHPDYAEVQERDGGLDWRAKAPNCTVISKIRDQSACGSCWAFGSTETFEDRHCVATGKDVEFSTSDTAGCCKGLFCGFSQGCGGGQPSAALKWFGRTGVVTGGDFGNDGDGSSCKPYPFETCAHHVPPTSGEPACPKKEFSITCTKECTDHKYGKTYASDKVKAGTASTIGSVAGMVAALEKGPISVAFSVYADFPTYKSGVYSHKTGAMLGGHAVEIIGYGTEAGTDYWLVKNSWNKMWGDGGCFKIKKGTNECGIEDQAATIDFN